MLKMESLIGDTGKQISEVVTAQQALKCDKAHPVPTSKKKKSQQSVSGAEIKAAKKRCKSDSESSEDEDELAKKSVLQSQQFQKSDQNIQNAMKNNDIDIYGLAETNLSYRQSKIWQQQFGFHGYFDYSQQGGKGQGVGIIVSNKYDIFVHKAVGHKGRVIYLDLNFSQKKNVRLIQVYINANKKERTQIEELYQYIENTIDDAKNKNMEIIIMGDFNINYRKYLMAFVNNRWYFKLFKMLENRHLLDTIPIFNEDDENIYTYIPPNDSNEKSRIDYIWASLPILGQSLNSTVIENDHFTTDHNTVTLSLDTQLFIGKTLPKINKSKKKITRTVFLYDEMDQEDDEFTWDNFRAGLDHEIERLKLKDRSITKRKHVDHVWDSLRQLIMKSANENIKNKKVIKQKIKCAPEKKLSVYFDLRYIINRIQEIRSCITGLRNYPNQETIDKWINYQNTIIKLKDKYELVTSDTSFNFLNNDQFHSYLDELNEIRKQLRIVFKLELNIMEQEQIISNIKKRCDNYKDDQGRMIQSITEKEMVSISIEKIYKKDHNGNEVLITDENQVMEETNRHFQTVAGSVNRKKPIQGRWKEQYKPQPHINENIYSGIMDAPSYDEWLDIIRQLSNGKATGPSGVSNEMLKHLSDDCNHILYYLISKHPHEPMRILGVYFNIEHDGNYLMFKIKNEIDHLVNLMYKKKITDKHILYIFNRIIVPRVEYWSQVMALSKTQTESLIIPFRRMFKNKLKFARSAPNAILDNPYIYGYRDFYDNQLQAKITDFCIQLNDNGLLGKVTEIRLKSLQDQLWTSRPLIEKLPYNRVPHTRKNNYILNMLLLCYDNNISLEYLDDNIFPSIKGGKIPLEDVVINFVYCYGKKYLLRLIFLFFHNGKKLNGIQILEI
ncbi:hypothetical protein RhiirB3_491131 [Rhizophagus irregularis]|nr:hypothetical protein RhiirB3_491131 [Rhizophagus irregularis]